MPKKGKQNRRGAPKKYRGTEELLIEQKSKRFIQAIKEYWAEQERLHKEFNRASAAFEVRPRGNELFPMDASGIVWLLKDGVVFVRFKTSGKHPPFQTRILDVTVQHWLQNIWVIPVGGREVSLAATFGGSSNITLINCQFNEIYVDYVHLSHAFYKGEALAPNQAKAILDFRITLLGIILQSGGAVLSPTRETAVPQEKTVEMLRDKTGQFRTLLSGGASEEDIQKFLKDNPFLLRPASEVIPKQKLGEDFVTDFALLNILDQGPIYTLVEIERASHRVLTKDKLLSEPVSRAIKQTRDWDVWLEQNKAYIQGKLHGFETPQYLIVIGRSNDMDAEEKAYLRSYNREYKNTALLTYDDLLKQAEEFLESLVRTAAPIEG
jgi:hypothetical protein